MSPPPDARSPKVATVALPRGLLATETRYLSPPSRMAYYALLAAIDETGDTLLADDESLAAVAGLSLGRWRRAKADLELRGRIRVVDLEADEEGRVLHPGWIEIPWYSEAVASASTKRAARVGAGRRSGEARRGEQNPAETRADAANDRPGDAETTNEPVVSGADQTNKPDDIDTGSANIVHPESPESLSLERERVDKELKGKQEPIPPAGARGDRRSLPADWTVPDDWRVQAAQDRAAAGLAPVNIAREAAAFVQHYRGNGTKSAAWAALFRKWVIQARVQPDDAKLVSMLPDANNVHENGGVSTSIVHVPTRYDGVISPIEWGRWFVEVEIVDAGSGGVIVRAPNPFIRENIERRFAEALARAHDGAAVEVVLKT